MTRNELHRFLQGARDLPDSAAFNAEIKEHHPADVASALSDFDAGDAQALLSRIPAEHRAAVFGYLSPQMQGILAAHSSRAELAQLLVHVSPDERVDLFNRLPADTGAALLPALAQAEREDLRRLAAFAEGTVGAVIC